MITAQEAKQLYDQSGAEVEEYLRLTVEPAVVNAAKGGKRYAFIHLGTTGPYEYIEGKITPLYWSVVDKLQELGYHTRFINDGEKYVPRGLADDDGNGPEHQNYGIQIGW